MHMPSTVCVHTFTHWVREVDILTHTHTHTHKYTNTHTGIHIDGIHAYTQQQTHRQRTTVGADKNLIRDAGTGIVKKEM